MRRFLYSFSLIFFLFIVFTWHAISAMTQDSMEEPPYVYVTLAGSTNIFENLTIEGYAHQQGFSEPFYLFNEKEQSLSGLRKLDTFSDPVLDELSAEHRAFFRGKRADHSFYIDDTFIVSANLPNPSTYGTKTNDLSISWLERETGKTLSFTTPIDLDHYYSFIVDMQMRGDTLLLLVEQSTRSSTELVLYEVNNSTHSLTDQQVIFTLPNDDDQYINVISDSFYFSPSSYIAWSVYGWETDTNELNFYSYDSFETNTLDLGSQIKEGANSSFSAFQDDEQVIFIEHLYDEKGANVRYLMIDLSEGKASDMHETLLRTEDMITVKQANGFLYVITAIHNSSNELAKVTVIDPVTNEEIHEGLIQYTDDSFRTGYYSFEFYYTQNDSQK